MMKIEQTHCHIKAMLRYIVSIHIGRRFEIEAWALTGKHDYNQKCHFSFAQIALSQTQYTCNRFTCDSKNGVLSCLSVMSLGSLMIPATKRVHRAAPKALWKAHGPRGAKVSQFKSQFFKQQQAQEGSSSGARGCRLCPKSQGIEVPSSLSVFKNAYFFPGRSSSTRSAMQRRFK
jgi:hypothetical protein